MPINTNTRERDSVSGTAKLSEDQQMVLFFGFIGLHESGAALDGVTAFGTTGRGNRSPYPPTALLAVLGCGRVARSLAAGLTALHTSPELWGRCSDAYEARSGVRLPSVPPSRDQVDHLRRRLIEKPLLMQRLQHSFRRAAVGQARLLGNLLPGVLPDWARPLEAHAIYGDGTHIARYSDVQEILDPRTGELVVVGGRSNGNGKRRIQRLTTDSAMDGKEGTVVTGLNMVSMHTWTAAGRVTLGTATALGAEQWAALTLAEELHSLAGDGIHSLIYDRAITGWTVDHLMANHRIQVISKAVAAVSEVAYDKVTDREVHDLVQRRTAELGIDHGGDLARLLRRDVLADMLRYHERQPLGTCIYPTTGRNFDLVRSTHHELEPVGHPTTGGECVHRLAHDDGGLYEITRHEDGGHDIKARVLRCTSSTPYQRPDGRWGTRSSYLIPCTHGDVPYHRTWEPTGARHSPETPAKDRRSPQDAVGWRLRPLSRADDIAEWYNRPGTGLDAHAGARPFGAVHGRRNDAESYNEWYQQSLRHHGRAASLDPAAQELDFLLAALLNNAIAWHHRPR